MYIEHKFWRLAAQPSLRLVALPPRIPLTYASACSGPGMAGVALQKIDMHRVCSAMRVLGKLLLR